MSIKLTRKEAIRALRLTHRGYYDYPQVSRYVTEHKDRVPLDHVIIDTRNYFAYDANSGQQKDTGKTSYIHVNETAVEALMAGTLKSFRSN